MIPYVDEDNEDIFRVPDDDFSAIISSEDEQIDIPFHPVISTDLVTLHECNPGSCCICLSTDAIYVFVPCGHLCICNDAWDIWKMANVRFVVKRSQHIFVRYQHKRNYRVFSTNFVLKTR
ncbi:hypothetical protein ALC57_09062 [Trachymyrmex cornetzi]|uniref:Uncharacterized protein n=1 Tax=Trachymyrmex cornetzi TaxID=471704 RepID=A0A151J5W8_9HYME|nr:hypothetical protein ALC57_09062 [Trachymyrmex cornetzi]